MAVTWNPKRTEQSNTGKFIIAAWCGEVLVNQSRKANFKKKEKKESKKERKSWETGWNAEFHKELAANWQLTWGKGRNMNL